MKVLLNILTHGDELIGLKVAKEVKNLLKNNQSVTVQIANPKAYRMKKRFIDQDLNRSFPGQKKGNYEQRLAFRLLSRIESADVVIDIHSTTSQLKDAMIVTKLDNATLKCLQAIQPKYVLIMEATKNQALISQAKIGLAFEYGNDRDAKVLGKVVNDITRLFCYLGLVHRSLPRRKTVMHFFRVTDAVAKPAGYRLCKSVKNYKLIRKGQAFAMKGKTALRAEDDFYPILFGQDNYDDQFGFKALKLHDSEVATQF